MNYIVDIFAILIAALLGFWAGMRHGLDHACIRITQAALRIGHKQAIDDVLDEVVRAIERRP